MNTGIRLLAAIAFAASFSTASAQDPIVKTLLYLEGAPVPGAGVAGSGTEALPAGSVWSAFGAPSINSAGDAAFSASVKAAGVTYTGIFTAGTTLQLVVKKGDLAPDTAGSTFSAMKDPVFSAAGIAFYGTILGGDAINSDHHCLFWKPNGGPLRMIARQRREPPGVPGGKWSGFQSIAIPDGATGPLFVAKLVSGFGGVTSASDTALWAVDSTGAVRLVVREGESVDTGGGAFKTVKAITVLPSVSISGGQQRSFNGSGEIIYRLFFTDGTEAVMTAQMP